MMPVIRDKNTKNLQGVAPIQRNINLQVNTKLKTSVHITRGFRCLHTDTQSMGNKQEALKMAGNCVGFRTPYVHLVDHAKWETPIVTQIKPDRSVHICVDYKCTINKAHQQHA